jgi:site-specific DNA recombinase
MCSNRVLIRQDRLEEQLIDGLTTKVLRLETVEYLFERFVEQLEQRLDSLKKSSSTAAAELNGLEKQRDELQAKARNLADAIAAMGHSPTLLTQLSSVESEIAGLDNRIRQVNSPKQFSVSIKEMKDFIARKVLDLTAVLRSDVPAARRALANHIRKLALSPKETPDGPMLEVSGDVDLFGGDDRVMLMVARDGIEPPTPAFSGLRAFLQGAAPLALCSRGTAFAPRSPLSAADFA